MTTNTVQKEVMPVSALSQAFIADEAWRHISFFFTALAATGRPPKRSARFLLEATQFVLKPVASGVLILCINLSIK